MFQKDYTRFENQLKVFPSPCGDVMFRLSIVKISWVRCFRPLAGM